MVEARLAVGPGVERVRLGIEEGGGLVFGFVAHFGALRKGLVRS